MKMRAACGLLVLGVALQVAVQVRADGVQLLQRIDLSDAATMEPVSTAAEGSVSEPSQAVAVAATLERSLNDSLKTNMSKIDNVMNSLTQLHKDLSKRVHRSKLEKAIFSKPMFPHTKAQISREQRGEKKTTEELLELVQQLMAQSPNGLQTRVCDAFGTWSKTCNKIAGRKPPCDPIAKVEAHNGMECDKQHVLVIVCSWS